MPGPRSSQRSPGIDAPSSEQAAALGVFTRTGHDGGAASGPETSHAGFPGQYRTHPGELPTQLRPVAGACYRRRLRERRRKAIKQAANIGGSGHPLLNGLNQITLPGSGHAPTLACSFVHAAQEIERKLGVAQRCRGLPRTAQAVAGPDRARRRAGALSRWRGSHVDVTMKKRKSLYHGHRFPAAVISLAVRWYFRFQLGLRDIEELLFERGVVVSYETIRRWCDKFGAGFAHRVKAARRKPGLHMAS
ncbi:hypothetical protein OKW49_006304 [Paraburkholderia youngii]